MANALQPKRFARALHTALVVLVASLVLVGAVAEPAMAQVKKFSFGTRNQKKMVKVYTLLQLEGTPEEQAVALLDAKEILGNINLKRAKPYGRARILQTLGGLAIQDGDNEKALGYLKACVAENALQPGDQLKTLFQVGQLHTILEEFDEAILALEEWFTLVESPAPSSYYVLSVTYYQAGRAEEALKPAQQAVDLSVDTPLERWYRLLLSLNLEAQNYVEALEILDDIILNYPKKAYWAQMAAIYSELDQMPKSLAVQQLAKGEGFITEDRDLTRIAQMFMVEGMPHRGAEVMKIGLADGSIEPTKQAYQTYSDTLLQSREWALAADPLEKAAELNKNGSLYVRLAQVHLQLGNWGDARGSLDNAFEKGELNDEGQAHILYGIAAFNDKQWNSAIRAFTRAERFDGTRETAGKWKAYVGREKARLGVE